MFQSNTLFNISLATQRIHMANVKHDSLNATFHGVVRGSVAQFRGIKYGQIPERFALPEGVDDWAGRNVECKKYGPKCPQQEFDVGHLLRLPEDVDIPKDEEDEFECLNLDVTMPAMADKRKGTLPVMVWIHGGSQVMTFGSASSGICDPTKIVEDSLKQSKPIIVVAMQYRLNIFAFGDGNSPKNLALKDQRLAIEWVRKHIAGFGGNPDNITIAGESAGAVYAHAHVVQNAPIKHAILMSGTLEMSPPRLLAHEATIVDPIEAKLASIGLSLRTASAAEIINVLKELNIVSMWLQQNPDEPELSDWTRTGRVQSLVIGDVEYEVRMQRKTGARGSNVNARRLSRSYGETESRH
ncbi:Carboxylesterase type B [Macrophomina phaseolina MS6]|uniref:Carboxylic ester hydrolase n=1 Tax=Macrophomina phaseolina (strain MS6) TaxID=1126212 RepID=K2SAC6_MACPH|nr:Carboxylesterase type B [Macrophomina phaseolina MS6]